MNQDVFDTVTQSYERCLKHHQFWEIFYEHFLAGSDAVAEKFKNTNFDKQVSMVRASVGYAISYAPNQDSEFLRGKLEKVGEIHSRAGHNIPPEMYEAWTASLIKAISICDPQYTTELAEAWGEVLRPAINLMTSKY